MAISLPIGVVDKEFVNIDDIGDKCDFSQGHCFGSDGGSGIPKDKQVSKDRGGRLEVWTLDDLKLVVLKKEIYDRCQFCQKYVYVDDVQEEVIE